MQNQLVEPATAHMLMFECPALTEYPNTLILYTLYPVMYLNL